MTDMKKLASEPIFFESNRVFRIYTGGKLLGDFLGKPEADGNLPEEWIASAVAALNKDAKPTDGISVIKGTGVLLTDLLAAEKELVLGAHDEFGVLIKYLCSAVRLPVQSHPNRAFSRQYFNSTYGKTESWMVLDTRPGAGVYFGFNRELTKEQFAQAVEDSLQNKEAMPELLQFVPVQKGDVFLVPAMVAHAIGAGCLILEVQEPTDFTIQPEAWCVDYQLNDFEKYLGLDPDIALDCFDFTAYGERALQLGKKTPVLVNSTDAWRVESLIGPDDTDCFAQNRHTVTKGQSGALTAPSVIVVTEGAGVLNLGEQSWAVKQGDYFMLPHSVAGKCTVTSDSMIEFSECLPGK